MFTGIVKSVGSVKEVKQEGAGKEVIITLPHSSTIDPNTIKIGDSIAVAGCCLTVTAKTGRELHFFISGDTITKTTLAMLRGGASVNLEPALKMGEPMGGHIVTGHVDEVAKVTEVINKENDHRIKLEVSNFAKNMLVPKGSITVDGVSLTVAYLERNVVTLNLIPHTLESTTLKNLNNTTNFLVNIEFDPVAKHVYKIVKNLILR